MRPVLFRVVFYFSGNTETWYYFGTAQFVKLGSLVVCKCLVL